MKRRIHVRENFKGLYPDGAILEHAIKLALNNKEFFKDNQPIFELKNIEIFVFHGTQSFEMYVTINLPPKP